MKEMGIIKVLFKFNAKLFSLLRGKVVECDVWG